MPTREVVRGLAPTKCGSMNTFQVTFALLAEIAHKAGQRRRLAEAALAGQKQMDLAVSQGELAKLLVEIVAADVCAHPRFNKALVQVGLRVQRIYLTGRVGQLQSRLDRVPQPILNMFAEVLQSVKSPFAAVDAIVPRWVPARGVWLHAEGAAFQFFPEIVKLSSEVWIGFEKNSGDRHERDILGPKVVEPTVRLPALCQQGRDAVVPPL